VQTRGITIVPSTLQPLTNESADRDIATWLAGICEDIVREGFAFRNGSAPYHADSGNLVP
jgi:hypothetical protein